MDQQLSISSNSNPLRTDSLVVISGNRARTEQGRKTAELSNLVERIRQHPSDNVLIREASPSDDQEEESGEEPVHNSPAKSFIASANTSSISNSRPRTEPADRMVLPPRQKERGKENDPLIVERVRAGMEDVAEEREETDEPKTKVPLQEWTGRAESAMKPSTRGGPSCRPDLPGTPASALGQRRESRDAELHRQVMEHLQLCKLSESAMWRDAQRRMRNEESGVTFRPKVCLSRLTESLDQS